MPSPLLQIGTRVTIKPPHLQEIIAAAKAQGYHLIGPTRQETAIVYDELPSAARLPAGWTDSQEPGKYRLQRRDDGALFQYGPSPHSWKRFLYPPVEALWHAERTDGSWRVIETELPTDKYALLGVRACDLQAIAILDQVFMLGPYSSPSYQARRQNILILAVNCTQASGNCFCTSMGTGPAVKSGFDLALTEVLDAEGHYLLIEIGTERGASLLEQVPCTEASEQEENRAAKRIAATAEQMPRRVEPIGLKQILYRNYDNPRWEQIGKRCLNCANCTMVCPTCSCTTVQDVTDLTGTRAERWREWDSCFTLDFSYIHGGSIRTSAMSRYRQWVMHKFATSSDQLGRPACVGCGRCITWCPAAIDITAEVHALSETVRQ